MLVEVRGAGVARGEMAIETMWGLARDGKTNRKGVPNPLQFAVIVREFRDVIRPTKPPPIVQRSGSASWLRSGASSATGRPTRSTASGGGPARTDEPARPDPDETRSRSREVPEHLSVRGLRLGVSHLSPPVIDHGLQSMTIRR